LESLLIEIRGAEGGEDAKLLAVDQFRVYARVAERRGFSIEITDERPGFIAFVVSGDGAKALFENECGGHRWQRVSPTERHGRIHTSTITVAVLDLGNDDHYTIREADIDFVATRGSGPGGQNRNKVETCIVATHKPTGISVRIDTRSQYQNKKIALQVLNARLSEMDRFKKLVEQNNDRKNQIGSGMRGDKIRTYREKDDQVMDHRTNKKMTLSSWLKGTW
jgi:peptide chain release factor 1